MKYALLFTFLLSLLSCQDKSGVINIKESDPTASTSSKLPFVDTSIFETFTYQEGDTTFLMKKYFMVHLKSGPNRDQNEDEAERIQIAHMAHLQQMALDQKLCIAGPFEGSEEMRGLAIMSVPDLATADSLANADPAVKAGRLTVEVIPFWAAVGSQLF
jgi:uncharacterized protein YciI